ncbi:methyltransferase family protein [Aminobacter aminovorans]|uniref:Type I restriction-modification system methyltransferase subunit n=1 Tax=Aminobacter aminovorans TaxID=83263 RepID=A0A380WMH7_AMIAI|nr:class I SAM-dependent methyltransferase [Aminobacter aminovorans]TCS28205.1 methyltransferase family protein [Aminobacter aminovorans]SUU89384.1 Type I restriction-modification system methyltransferase subunit [Aminobacter aminovorans]
MNALARQSTVSDLIDEYDQKRAAMESEVASFEAAYLKLEMAACIQGKFVAPVSRNRPHISAEELKRNLCKSGWKAIYDRLQIDRIASAKDRKLFERTVESPPELTFDNAKATFGDYLERPRHHILRGLAEVFADLDPAYKSHSKVKIGVKGLPKRVILSSFGSFYGNYGRDKFRDIVNALAAYRGQPLMEYSEFSAIDVAHRNGEDAILDGRVYAGEPRYGKVEEHQTFDRGLWIRKFSNGNAHVFFGPETLLDINKALAEFYGEVLPDAEEEDAKPKTGTAVSKDLQFYWSPADVIERALELAGLYNLRDWNHNPPEPSRVLEPSCGDGRIMDAVRKRGHHVFGIEYHAGRAAEARAKGHNVLSANFLECPPKPDFDFVVMNPPFYGRHYVKHVRHALKFLKPGGQLVSILPATAHYDHDELQGEWRDLPVGSFAEAGTNVPTGLLKIRRPA